LETGVNVRTFPSTTRAEPEPVAISVISEPISGGVFPTRDSFNEKRIRPCEDQMVTATMVPSDETDFRSLSASLS
jgi:hypothetical protein